MYLAHIVHITGDRLKGVSQMLEYKGLLSRKVVQMLGHKSLLCGENPRTVLRGCNSQKQNEVGIHWLRISIPRRYLGELEEYCSLYFGESSEDGYGLWSYAARCAWPNGVSLNYDLDSVWADRWHNGKATLDIPGQACDEIEDLHLFIIGLRRFCPTCTRCDVFFDDYNGIVRPSFLQSIAKRGDYSGFRKFQIKQGFESKRLVRDEISFGTRGERGSGKYLRVYDKALESNGEQDCIRWEVEFTGKCAHKVFEKLSQVDTVEAFATLCGSLVAGSINFVYRTGDKNIYRLNVYEFWQLLREALGVLNIRVAKKPNDINGMHQWIYKQVSPTLACMRGTFQDDIDFINFLLDVTKEGGLRMSKRLINIARSNKRKLRYFGEGILERGQFSVA